MNTLKNLLLLSGPITLALIAAPVAAHPHHATEDTKSITITIDDDDDDGRQNIDVESLLVSGDHGFMGIEMDDLTTQLGEYFGVDDGHGVLVKVVREDSPAATAGLRAGDVIVDLDDQAVPSTRALRRAMTNTEPEQKITVKYLRKGKKKHTQITLGEMPGKSHMVRSFGGYGRMPRGPHMMREMHEDRDDLEDVRHELADLRRELAELRAELQK